MGATDFPLDGARRLPMNASCAAAAANGSAIKAALPALYSILRIDTLREQWERSALSQHRAWMLPRLWVAVWYSAVVVAGPVAVACPGSAGTGRRLLTCPP